MAEANYEFKKSTKYLLLFVFLLLLLGIGFVVRGFIMPWLQVTVDPYYGERIQIDESLLRSADLATLVQFNHISYPDRPMGRINILEWSAAEPEAEIEEPEVEPEVETEVETESE
jgi:hypothetical protein